MRRWWFWYVLRGDGRWQAFGPEYLSQYDAFILEERTRQRYATPALYRWYYSTRARAWVYDGRNAREFLASAS